MDFRNLFRSTTIIQASPPNTGSTVLANAIYGFLKPNKPVAYCGSARQLKRSSITIAKTHNLDFDRWSEFNPKANLYFVCSEREGYPRITKPSQRNIIIDYQQLCETETYPLVQIVDKLEELLSNFLPDHLVLNKATCLKRLTEMNNRYDEIKHLPFSIVDKFYHIHGSHRGTKPEDRKADSFEYI
jgi:hypothetical protein